MALDNLEERLISDEDYRKKYREANAALIEIFEISHEVANMLKDVLFSTYNMVWCEMRRPILMKRWVLTEYRENFSLLVDFTLSLEKNLEQVSEIEEEYDDFKSQFFPSSPATNENYYFINQLLIKLWHKKC